MRPSRHYVQTLMHSKWTQVRLLTPCLALHQHPSLSDNKIAYLEQTIQELRVQLAESQHIQINRANEQNHQCESLYAQGRIYDAAESLLEMANTVNEDVRTDKLILDWLPGEFRRRALG